MYGKIVVSMGLPEERIVDLRYLYIVIDSEFNVHYEFHNWGGHKRFIKYLLKPNLFKLNFQAILDSTPESLIKTCASPKQNIIGVLSLEIDYAKDYSYARVLAVGISDAFRGNRLKAIRKLYEAMDNFCKSYRVRFVEIETRVFPPNILKRYGFFPEPERKLMYKILQRLTNQTHYVKRY